MYLQQAYEGKNQWWRYVITLLIVLLISNLLGAIPFVILAAIKGDLGSYLQTFDPVSIGLSQNAGLVLLMIPTVFSFIAILLCFRFIHEVSWTKIFTSAKSFRWNRYFFAFFLWFIFLAVVEFISYQMNPDNYIFNYSGAQFWYLVVISIIMIPIQTAWEELYFRGNLMQGFAVLTHTRYLPLILTSVLFAAMHLGNPEIDEYGKLNALTIYICFGILMGITVIMDNGIEMALGLHAVNNFFAAVLVGYEGSVLQTPSLFKSTNIEPQYMIIAIVVTGALFLMISKKTLKWNSWSKLISPLIPPQQSTETKM